MFVSLRHEFAPQRMEHPGARWVVAIDSRTTSAICEVADEGVSTTQGNSEESSRVSGWPPTVVRSAWPATGRSDPIPHTSEGVEEGEVSDPSASGG